jgi:hypothetical protein
MCLTGWLIQQLLHLRHRNDSPLIQLYGLASTFADVYQYVRFAETFVEA